MKGLHTHRLTHPASALERAFAEQWDVENERKGLCEPVLQLLLYQRAPKKGEVPVSPFGTIVDGIPTEREQEVAATVIQWLGTNVGYCFLEMALAKVGKRIVSKEAK